MRGRTAHGLLALAIGAGGGLAFFFLDLPLPWVLGAITATAIVAQTTKLRPELPGRWRGYAMVAIGTMLGTGFTPDVVRHAGDWAFSLLVMVALSFVFYGAAFFVFTRWGRMDRLTALFASMPGGLSVTTVLSDQYGAEANRIVLCHTARLIVLLASAPILIETISGIDLSAANTAAYTSAEAIDPLRHGALVLVAIVSWAIARRLRLPSGMLLIPLLASAVFHASGILTVHVPPVLSNLAQITIGAGVGARFANYTLREISRDGWLAALVGVGLAAGSLAGALVIAPLTGVDFAPLFLSYLPGGAPELGVVALALKIDPAMVAAHHVLRVVIIIALLPIAASRIVRDAPREPAGQVD